MIANALLITVAVMLATGFTLMGELKFFIPFKVIIWRAYSTYTLSYCGLLFASVFAAAFALDREFFISGATGCGKTTLLNALSGFTPDEDRILLIEDTSEIQLEKPNLVRFEVRQNAPLLRSKEFETPITIRSESPITIIGISTPGLRGGDLLYDRPSLDYHF